MSETKQTTGNKIADMDHLRKIAKNLNELRKDSFLTDIVLRCDDVSICAHKVVLATRSKFFFEMFESQPDKDVVELQIKPDILKILLQYIYTGVVNTVDESNLENILIASDFLRLDLVEEHSLLLKILDEKNVMEYMNIAEKMNLNSLKEAVLSNMAANFCTLVESDVFTNLPKEYAKSVLTCSELKCTEDEKFSAILKWMKYNKSNEEGNTDDFISAVDFTKLSNDILKKFTEDSSKINDNRINREVVKELTKRMKSLLLSRSRNPSGDSLASEKNFSGTKMIPSSSNSVRNSPNNTSYDQTTRSSTKEFSGRKYDRNNQKFNKFHPSSRRNTYSVNEKSVEPKATDKAKDPSVLQERQS